MRVGFLIPEFPTQTHIFFWREMNALAASGVDVAVISTRAPKEQCPHPFAAAARQRTHYIFPPAPSSLSVALRPWRAVQALRYLASLEEGGRRRLRHAILLACATELARYSRLAGLDHLHVHSFADAAHVAAMALSLGGPRYSLRLHGDLEVYGQDHKQKVAAAAFVAAVSSPLRERVIAEGLAPADRVCMIPMGVDIERFRPTEHRSTSEGTATAPLRAVTVSRLHRSKGHRFALEAIRRLLDGGLHLTYDLVGSGPHQAEIEECINRLHLERHVRILGPMSEEGIRDILRNCDLFLLPSVGRGEASPVAVMEAMACGVAVVVSRIGGTPDMIDHLRDGLLVDQGDVSALVEAIRYLASSGNRRSIGEAARHRATHSFDSAVRASELLNAIRRNSTGAPG